MKISPILESKKFKDASEMLQAMFKDLQNLSAQFKELGNDPDEDMQVMHGSHVSEEIDEIIQKYQNASVRVRRP